MYNKTPMRSANKQSTFQKCTNRSIEIRQKSHSTHTVYNIYTLEFQLYYSMIHQCLEGGYLCICDEDTKQENAFFF